MKKNIALIGVPSSAGAHWPGQEKTPKYLRKAGLIAHLEASGLNVNDYGDLPLVRFKPDAEQRYQQNLAAVVEVCNQVANQVDLAIKSNSIPLVIGGDCTISLGVIAGFLRHNEDIGLMYFDGHVDLNTPATSPSGILDSMGIAHMIGEPGTADELSHIAVRFPMMSEDKIVLFGYNTHETNTSEDEVLDQRQFLKYPISDVQDDVTDAAIEAVKYLELQAKRFVVHFDVDVVDFTDLPIADVPQFSEGLMFKDVLKCLSVFTSSPNFSGLTVTEFNPDHVDEEGTNALTFIKGLAQSLAGI